MINNFFGFRLFLTFIFKSFCFFDYVSASVFIQICVFLFVAKRSIWPVQIPLMSGLSTRKTSTHTHDVKTWHWRWIQLRYFPFVMDLVLTLISDSKILVDWMQYCQYWCGRFDSRKAASCVGTFMANHSRKFNHSSTNRISDEKILKQILQILHRKHFCDKI